VGNANDDDDNDDNDDVEIIGPENGDSPHTDTLSDTVNRTRNQPLRQGGAHGGRAPAKIVRAPAKITGLIMLHLCCQNFFGILAIFGINNKCVSSFMIRFQ